MRRKLMTTASADDDDLIELGECTEYENVVWKFPQTLNCPGCKEVFKTRQQIIKHYREKHAKFVMLCKLCNHPIKLLTAVHLLSSHYERMHPNVTPPAKVKFRRFDCSVCKTSLKNYVVLRTHMIKQHGTLPESEHLAIDDAKGPDDDKIAMNKMSRKSSDSSELKRSKATQLLRRLVIRKDRLFNVQKVRPCTICRRNLKNYTLACLHYRREHGKTPSMCPFCKRYFTSSIRFMHHMADKHPLKKGVAPNGKKFFRVSNRPHSTSKKEIPSDSMKVTDDTASTQIAQKTMTIPIKCSEAVKRSERISQRREATDSRENMVAKLQLKAEQGGTKQKKPNHPIVVISDDENESTRNTPNERIDDSLDDRNHSGEMLDTRSTRSTRIRYKVCTICGSTLKSFASACEHYRMAHGRNVMICPYCQKYFLQSSNLTDHVLKKHSNEASICTIGRPETFVPTQTKKTPKKKVVKQENAQEVCDSCDISMIMSVSSSDQCSSPVPMNEEPLNLVLPKKTPSDENALHSFDCALDLSLPK